MILKIFVKFIKVSFFELQTIENKKFL